MSDVEPSETVILCEGYHDRAFWDGLLRYLGCTSLRPPPGQVVSDPFGAAVKGGEYGYTSQTGKFIRVRPCHTKNGIRPAARTRLRERTRKRLNQLVLNVDADQNADGTPNASRTINRQSVEDLLQSDISVAFSSTPQGTLLIDGGATEICLIRWEAGDDTVDYLPNQQTLERWVCAALAAAYPDRGDSVRQWLASRQNPPALGVKEFAFSHMAGWYAERGCEAFYTCLWDDKDERIIAELRTRLEASGAWQIAQSLTV